MTKKTAENKTIIITGASGLLGTSFVKKMVSRNYNVVALDKNIKSLISLNKIYENRKFSSFGIDLLDEKKLNKLKYKILKKYESIEYLVNCAALDAKVNKKK